MDSMAHIPFEERSAMADEYIRAFKELWSSQNPSFEGKYLNFSDITLLPKPVQHPYPSLWVGGESRAAIRMAGQSGNAWYSTGTDSKLSTRGTEELAVGMRRLAVQAEKAGRALSEVEVIYRTHQYRLFNEGISGSRPCFYGSAEQVAADVRAYEELGVSGLVIDLGQVSRNADDVLEHLEDLATRVIPAV